jgi:hypothetical protein
MKQFRNCCACNPFGPRPCGVDLPSIRRDFYREEFLKLQRCLQQQREYYSERAITSVEAALSRILSQLEQLSAQEDADQVVSRLLRKFDVVTGLTGWTDPRHIH